jgi:glutamate/tyrosine decarboxylase-like PLP-dependent enzyme
MRIAEEKDTGVRNRESALSMNAPEFRALGHRLVDQIAHFLESLPERKVTPSEAPMEVRHALQADRALPKKGEDAGTILDRTTDLLMEHSLLNGHPRFWGYITSSAAPIGALGDLLAAAVNPNVGAWALSPMASEIEAQTIRWIAEMLGFPTDCGGLFVSGGNMANLVCVLAARQAKAGWDLRKEGLKGTPLRIYCSSETHTWVQKAADVAGLGTDAIRWIAANSQMQMDLSALRDQIVLDLAAGDRPFLVIGTAGTVSTGTFDPLREMAMICREFNLWFHIDGAYGALAVMAKDPPPELAGMREADSIAVDPHKWLYAPLEAGCAFVRRPAHLRNAFAYHPPYYLFGTEAINYFDMGPQNSRGFRALKVWLALQQAGQEGYAQMISDDISLAKELYLQVSQRPDFDALSCSLSITTFRFVPLGLDRTHADTEAYLDRLNREILSRLNNSGKVYLSNAIVNGKFAIRACIVNFRTSQSDIRELPPLALQIGREIDLELRPAALRTKWS